MYVYIYIFNMTSRYSLMGALWESNRWLPPVQCTSWRRFQRSIGVVTFKAMEAAIQGFSNEIYVGVDVDRTMHKDAFLVLIS